MLVTRLRACVALALLALLALLPAAAARAAEDADESLNYRVASWDRNNGLPSGGITALMAAADGPLWVGMDIGLYRFDGLRFRRVDGSGTAVTHLKAGGDGSVWVALADGSVTRILDGRMTRFDHRHGLPGIAASALVEDDQHRLWLGTRRGLYLLDGERWVRSTPAGLPENLQVNGAAIDRHGNMLVSANNVLYRRTAGSRAFAQLATFDVPGSANGICSTTPDRVYITDPTRGFAVIGSPGGPASPSRSVGLRLLCDRNNNVWVGTGGRGLWRIPPTAGSGPAHVLTGLLGELASSLAEDDRGNIWVGTPAGLTRLSPNPMVRLADLGVSTATVTTPDGHLWVGTLDGLVELIPSTSGVKESQRYLPGLRIRALHVDRSGIWIGSERGVARLDLTTRSVTPLAATDTPLLQVDSVSSGAGGDLWIADGDRGLHRWNGSRLTPVTLPFNVRENPVNAVHVDRSSNVWLALERGVAVIRESGRIEVFPDAGSGRAARRSRSIIEDSRGIIWVGGVDSLVWFGTDGHHVVTQADGFPVDFVKGLGEDAAGDIWIAGDAAIVRIGRSEFERSRESASRPVAVRYTSFDAADGAGVPRLLGDRAVTRAPNGVLWFITGNGITGIDPRLPSFHNTAVPVASIVGALADGKPLDSLEQTRFPSRTRSVQIDYSALNIDSPHRTRFRYRLRGFDDTWQDAGARLTAFYTNLPPGQYAFEVAASNEVNEWGAPTGTWLFYVEPAFYQTAWFPLACAGLLAFTGWGIWRFRLAQVRKQFGIVLGERVRLSREIHDTLLQSLVGVAIQCEVLAKDVERSPGGARESLLRLRRQVESHIREFRQAVSDLRAERDDFISSIRAAGETAERLSGVQFDLVVRGRPRPSPEEVERQLIKIAREAVSNAARHAQASNISVEVGYEDSSLRLRVRDDGRGFDPDESLHIAEGHCGLTSMKERAVEIGARLSISSAFGQGTQVEAVVPLSPA
jgi:ligand-binding sensor domain-containing protein